MITGEQGLFAQTNHAANSYKAAQENEAIHLDALMNSEYLTGLIEFNLSLSTSSTTEVTISGSTTGNGTITYKYALQTTATEPNCELSRSGRKAWWLLQQ